MNDATPFACCQTLTEVLAGPAEGADPTVFVDENDVLLMTVGLMETPGGLGLIDHAVHYCPFCCTALQTAAEINAKASD